MNQILATNSQKMNNKPKKEKQPKMSRTSGTTDVAKVAKIFAIILLLFGICVIGTGSYAIYQSGQLGNEVTMVNPVISLEEVPEDETTLLLTVTSNIGIDHVAYQWNDEKQTTLSGNSSAYVEQKIQIPAGSNILKITATDIQNNESTYTKKCELESNIILEATDTGKIKISYEGDKEIAYMTYRWDDGEEETIDIDANTINEEIETLSGRHTLTVVVVDAENHTETKVQETNGVSIPKIDIQSNRPENTAYIITVTDDIELKEVVVTLNDDDTKRYGQKLSGKEYTFQIPLQNGSDNKLKVEVTNSDNQKAERKVKFTK